MQILKPFFFIFLSAFFLCLTSHAQNYRSPFKSAIGLRAGIYSGVSYKQFLKQNNSIEILGQTRFEGILLTGLYEWNYHLFDNPNFNGFLGLGAHLASYGSGKFENRSGVPYQDNVLNFGIDGIAGVEYIFEDAPLTFGLDIKPFVDLVNPGSDYVDAAVTIRYILRK